MVKPPKAAIYRGRSAERWFWWVVPLKRCANSKIKKVLSWMFFYSVTMYLKHIKHITYFYNNNLTGCFWGGSLPKFREFCVLQSLHSLYGLFSPLHDPSLQLPMILGIIELLPQVGAYGGAWNQNCDKALTEGLSRAEIRDRGPLKSHKDFDNLNLKMYNLAIVIERKLMTISSQRKVRTNEQGPMHPLK